MLCLRHAGVGARVGLGQGARSRVAITRDR